MLLLGRKAGQSVYIGNDVRVTVVAIDDKQVKLGFDAPKETEILREEVKDRYESK